MITFAAAAAIYAVAVLSFFLGYQVRGAFDAQEARP